MIWFINYDSPSSGVSIPSIGSSIPSISAWYNLKKSKILYFIFFCENRNILCVEKYRLIVIDVIPSMEYAHSTDMARQTLNDEQIEQYWKNMEKISNL